MHARLTRVFLPCLKVGLHLELAQAVERDDVELVHRSVVRRRVTCAHHHPAIGNAVASERFELQELKHRRIKRLGNAVDLVKEQNAARTTRLGHVVVNRGDDLRHRVLGNVNVAAAVLLAHHNGKAQRALTRVMGHRVRNQADAQLIGDLRHDGSLADTRRAQQENGALVCNGDAVHPGFVFRQVCLNRLLDLLFRICDVHLRPPCMPLTAAFGASRSPAPKAGGCPLDR